MGEFSVPTCALLTLDLFVYIGKKQASDVLMQHKITLGELNA